MKRGAIRQVTWDESAVREESRPGIKEDEVQEGTASLLEVMAVAAPVGMVPGPPQIKPVPKDAAEEAKILLRIAAEVEGALLVQYLYSAYSILPGITRDIPGIGHISSDDWYNVIRDIATQEMGHLITVQNLLLALNAAPHVDRENFPWVDSGLFPFPFHLEKLDLETLAKAVAAEAPKEVAAADKNDYIEAAKRANAVAGRVSRVGQIYERLYYLFQDDDNPQAPWDSVTNPFPEWPLRHVSAAFIGFNQDRQAQTLEWWGEGLGGNADTAIYVLPVADLAAARQAIFKIAQQGEGPPDAGESDTHFDKFLRLYREFREYNKHADWPVVVRNQATDPTAGAGGTVATITDPAALQWASLANVRYELLLLYIALALTVGSTGSVTGTTAKRADLVDWVRKEMKSVIKKLGEELRAMPLEAGAAADSVRAGLPFELPAVHDLPTTSPEQVAEIRHLLTQSQTIRRTIGEKFSPTPTQKRLLSVVDDADKTISQKIGSAG